MMALYVFSLLVGGALLAIAAFGAGDHGADVHSDVDLAGHHDSAGATKLFSLRTLTYFLFVFGGVGSALSWAWGGRMALVTLALSLVAGLGVGGLVALAFRYLARTSSGDQVGEDSFVGLAGRVVLPIGEGGLGKVLVQRGDRSFELLARPMETQAAGSRTWKSVVVVEMRRGTALVAPLDDAVMPEISGS